MTDELDPRCAACKGACCEDFEVPMVKGDHDTAQWINLHGHPSRDGQLIRFDCRCTALADSGLCSIYENRPTVCRMFAPGSPACLASVKRRRSRIMFDFVSGFDSGHTSGIVSGSEDS